MANPGTHPPPRWESLRGLTAGTHRRRVFPGGSIALAAALALVLTVILQGCAGGTVRVAAGPSAGAPEERAPSAHRGFAVVYDLAMLFPESERKNAFAGVHTYPKVFDIDGLLHRGIFQHAGLPGKPLTEIRYKSLAFPRLRAGERLVFRCTATLNARSFDGVAFIVAVGDREVFRRRLHAGERVPVRIDLTDFAGRAADLYLRIDPLQNNGHDGAVWLNPVIGVEGRRSGTTAHGIPDWFRTAELMRSTPTPRRTAYVAESEDSVTLVTVQDEFLDLAVQTGRRKQPRAGRRRVPLPPRLVVGEGADEANHTIIKILNRFGVADVQFLAWPPEVGGGVQVCTARTASGAVRIVAAPLLARGVHEVRIFDDKGGLRKIVLPPASVLPPYRIACGDFLPAVPGDEIAVASRSAPERESVSEVVFLGLDGTVRTRNDLPGMEEPTSLSVITTPGDAGARLLVFDAVQGRAWFVDARRNTVRTVRSPDLRSCTGLYPPPDGSRHLWAGTAGSTLSIVRVFDVDGRLLDRLDVGRYENLFWVTTPAPSGATRKNTRHPAIEDLTRMKDGRYVRFCRYAHLRMDATSPGYRNPRFDCQDPRWWAGPPIRVPSLKAQRPAMWEPCFTHRAFPFFEPWTKVRDAGTGLPLYVMLTRTNKRDRYLEMGSSFLLSTYALGLPALNHLYLDRLSAFLAELAVRFRENPERFPSLEPNHENEIPIKGDFSIGDYNPAMVRGFFEYLVRMYGADFSHWKTVFGVDFAALGRFDAPRWAERGSWDAYGRRNPFFNAWLYYNRYVVNRRLAQGAVESLLAGFPPEVIKFHQIPDVYIRGGDLGFSKVPSRITPIDFALSCGLGYGFTRYGVWYRNRHNVVQGGYSSGQAAMIVGEYQALTKDPEQAAAQLSYMFEHGVQGVHCMGWREKRFNETMAEAVRRLLERDAPRPGLAGGVGQIRLFRTGNRTVAIGALGTGPDHNGLLKSLRSDGAWEGSVYVAPFKAHVDIETILRIPQAVLRPGTAVTTSVLDGFDGGSQVEIVFAAQAIDGAEATLIFQVLHGDAVLPGLSRSLAVTRQVRRYRIVHRFQLPADGVRFRLLAGKGVSRLQDIGVFRHTARVAHVHRGIFEGVRHRGGITFAILPH